MFLKRLSAVLVIITCLGYAALGAAPETLTSASNNGNENSVLAPLAPSLILTSTNSCGDLSNGTITVKIDPLSGTPPYSFKLEKVGGILQQAVNNQDSPYTFKDLAPGKYNVYVTDSKLQPGESQIDVYKTSLLLQKSSPWIFPGCVGETATISFKGIGGVEPYNYSLYRDGVAYSTNSVGVFNNLPDGNYTAIVTDANLCYSNYDGTITINKLVPINIAHTVINEIKCDDELASVQITSLPSDPFNIEVKNSSGKIYYNHNADYVYSNLDAGNYTVTVSRISCPSESDVDNFTIEPFNTITVTAIPPSPVKLDCGGIDDLTNVKVTVAGGNSNRQVRVVLDNNDGNSLNDPDRVGAYNVEFTFENVVAGGYTIRWNDVLNPACSGNQPYSITSPTPLTWVTDPVVTNVLCNGGSTGTISVNVTGGTTPRTTYVDDVAVVSTPIYKAAGTYSVYVKDNKECTTETKQVVITQPDVLSLSVLDLTEQLTCPNSNTGRIFARAFGGNKKYYYTLMKNGKDVSPYSDYRGNDTMVFSNLSAGIYQVTVDDHVCTPTAPVSEEIDSINVSLKIGFDPIKCNNGTTNINVSASGGIGSLFTYKIINTKTNNTLPSQTETNSGSGVTFANVAASSYRIEANNGTCTPTFKDTLIENPRLLTVTYPATVNLKCPGELASIVISASGSYPFQISADGGLSYSTFNTTQGIHTIQGLSAGSYTYLIKDKFDCVFNNGSPITITVVEPSPITTTLPVPVDAKCNSKSSGSISLTVSGGTPGYTLYLVDASNADTITPSTTSLTGVNVKIQNVFAGTYNLGITDRNGCVATNLPTGIVINEPEPLVIDPPVYDQIKCFGTTTKVIITASGGWPLLTPNIKIVGGTVNTSVSSGWINTLGAGTYTLTASNTDGCTANDVLTISQPEKLVLDVTKVDNVSCNGANDAKISFSVKGGVPDYLYGLGGSGSASTSFTDTSYTISSGLEAISAGYKLVIKDAKGCQSNIVPVTITEPTVVDFTYTTDSVTCFGLNDGKIIIYGNGGNDNSYRAILNGVETTFPVINGLIAGTYNLRITDSKNCTSETKIVTIGQPTKIVINGAIISDSVSCNNDMDASITVNAIGGQPYILQYMISGSDNRSYQLSNKFTGLQGGDYDVFVSIINKGINYCETKFPTRLIITNPEKISLIEDIIVTDVSCHNLQDGSVTIKAKGGTGKLTYSLVNAPVNIQPNPNTSGRFSQLGDLNSTSATYNYRVEDDKGCKKTGSFPILNPPELKIAELDHHDVLCSSQSNGWIEVEVIGGTKDYSFQRNTGSAVTTDVEKLTETSYKITKFGGGTFTPVVIDANGCTETLTPSVTIVDPKPLEIVDPIDWGVKKCNGDMDDITTITVAGGTPGYYYSLDNGESYGELNDSIFVGIPAGVKYPRVKDKYGCLSPEPESYIMKEPLLLEVDYKFFPILCYDDKYGNMELKITGGNGPYTFSLSDPPFTSPGTDVFPNASTDTTTVLLSDEGINLEPGTTYHFYLKDANGCHLQNFPKVRDVSHSFADTSFIRPTELFLDSLAPHRVWCGDSATGRIEFFAHGGTAPLKYSNYSLKVIPDERPDLSYKNVPGVNSVERLRAGLYYCILTDKNGCSAKPKTDKSHYTDTTTIDASNKAIVLTVSGLDTITCDNSLDGAIEITVKNFLEDGIFWDAQIWQNDTIRSTRPYTTTDDGYIEADPRSSEGYQGHFLYSAYAKKIMEDIGIGRYIITVTDSQTRCMASVDTILYSLNGDSCPPLNFYNTFTHYSGGNKYNDWKLGGSKNLVYNLKIYTSWGDLVYDSYDKNGVQKVTAADRNGIKWDGLDNKQRPVPAGTYIYLLRTGIAPNDTLRNGNITILRNNGR